MRTRGAAGGGAALGFGALLAPAAEAGTFTVTNTDGSGDGSLPQEVVDAKQAPGDDVVVFQAGLSGTISLDGADSDMEVTGDSLAIEAPAPARSRWTAPARIASSTCTGSARVRRSRSPA
jgi:hypothetical protein